MTTNNQLGFDIIPTQLAVTAMRDAGYKNAAHAVAELIDNSIQAGADEVKVLARETVDTVSQRALYRLSDVAVLDNGSGMDEHTLRIALQFGNGSRLGDRSGIGRFGMGLPSSSISQCRRVEVWTWQSAGDIPLYSYLDLDEIGNGLMKEVPDPIRKKIPDYWINVGDITGSSGTLVIWSNLDRCTWKRATTLLENSEFVIARMYRNFLNEGQTTITFAAYRDRDLQPEYEWDADPNDPGYLMSPSLTPDPWDEKPLFDEFGEKYLIPINIDFNGQSHTVNLKFSVVKDEVRKSPGAGASDHGKHAAKNIGVSLVRAKRELVLDKTVVINYDPRERWWGVEVEFPPSLDEVFGVTNNKQEALNFTDATRLAQDAEELAKNAGMTVEGWRASLREDNDPLEPLFEVASTIIRVLRPLRDHVKAAGRRLPKTRGAFDPKSAEAIGTKATLERQQDGRRGASDADESLPLDERRKAIEEDLVEQGVDPSTANELAARTTSNGIKYLFEERDIDSPAFFSVRNRGGVVLVTLNTDHPAHKHLLEVLDANDADGDNNSIDATELKERLDNASVGLKLLLEAWARYEDEATDRDRDVARDIRTDWGRIARNFVAGMED